MLVAVMYPTLVHVRSQEQSDVDGVVVVVVVVVVVSEGVLVPHQPSYVMGT